ETIEARKAAACDILNAIDLNAIDQTKDWDLALDCVVGAVVGFETAFTQDSRVVESLVNAIRDHDSAFPADLCENALELRVIAALAIGEMLVRGGESPPKRDSILIGAVLQSGFGIRPYPDGKYLRQMIDELHSAG